VNRILRLTGFLKGASMGVRHWHGGKLVLLWCIGTLISLQLFYTGRNIFDAGGSTQAALGVMCLAVACAIAGMLFMITWNWLGGKE